MCIIIAKPAGVEKPSDEIIAKCWQTNPDGAGLMYPNVHGTLSVVKGLMTLAAFKASWDIIPKEATVVAHFRIATHGGVDEQNTHPFRLDQQDTAMCHNGILPVARMEQAKGVDSDTAVLARDFLAKLPVFWYKDPVMCHVVEEYMGRGNKIVVLDKAHHITILNKIQGETEGGVWYSNTSFRPFVYRPVTNPYPFQHGCQRTWGEDGEWEAEYAAERAVTIISDGTVGEDDGHTHDPKDGRIVKGHPGVRLPALPAPKNYEPKKYNPTLGRVLPVGCEDEPVSDFVFMFRDETHTREGTNRAKAKFYCSYNNDDLVTQASKMLRLAKQKFKLTRSDMRNLISDLQRCIILPEPAMEIILEWEEEKELPDCYQQAMANDRLDVRKIVTDAINGTEETRVIIPPTRTKEVQFLDTALEQIDKVKEKEAMRLAGLAQ